MEIQSDADSRADRPDDCRRGGEKKCLKPKNNQQAAYLQGLVSSARQRKIRQARQGLDVPGQLDWHGRVAVVGVEGLIADPVVADPYCEGPLRLGARAAHANRQPIC